MTCESLHTFDWFCKENKGNRNLESFIPFEFIPIFIWHEIFEHFSVYSIRMNRCAYFVCDFHKFVDKSMSERIFQVQKDIESIPTRRKLHIIHAHLHNDLFFMVCEHLSVSFQ